MANGTVSVNSGTDIIDTSQLTVGGTSVERQRIVIADDSNGAALGKVANTTPTGTDYALNVALSPNSAPIDFRAGGTALSATTNNELVVTFKDMVPSPLNITVQDTGSSVTTGANSQSIITGSATAGSTVSQSVSGDSSFSVQISGTWTGTMQFERSLDAGVTWTAIGMFSAGTSYTSQTVTQNGSFHGNASSSTTVRVRSIAAMTGTAVVRILAGAGTGTVTIGNPIRLWDNNSGSSATIKPASTAAIAADPAVVVAVSPNNILNVAGTFWQTTQPVSLSPAISGGLVAFKLVSAATTNATVVKNSAGQLFGWYIYNSNSSARKVSFHNTSTTPTAGANVLFSVVIPAGSAANVEFTNGVAFSSGIGITTTTGLADNDTTVVAAQDLIISLFYK